MKELLILDPGTNNGISLLSVSKDTVYIDRAEIVTGTDAFIKWLIDMKMKDRSFQAICEDWINYMGLDSNEVNQGIGAFRFWTALNSNYPLVLRPPQSRELSRGVFKFTKPSHDNDALSATLHGLSYALKEKLITPKTKLIFKNDLQQNITCYYKPPTPTQ